MIESVDTSVSLSFARLAARACIMQACHSQPENHDATCSVAVERLAPRSQVGFESGYRVARNGCKADLSGHFSRGGAELQTNAAQTRRQMSPDRNRSHNVAHCTAVLRVSAVVGSFTCGLENTSSADRHPTARRLSDDSRQTTQILAAQSMSVEESTVSVTRRSSRLIVRSQTAFDRSHPAKLKTRGTFAAPAL